MGLKTRLIFLISLSLFIAGCGSRKESCSDLTSKILKAEINSDLKISVPGLVNTLKIGDDINLIVDNRSNVPIEVAPDNDLKIYWKQDDVWGEVDNQMDYLGVVERIPIRTNLNPGGTTYGIIISLPEKQQSAQICIILRGVKDLNGIRSEVGAFVELSLHR